MAWSWRHFTPDGEELPATDVAFPTQADAESWLGEHWRQMVEDGVESVTLLEDSREVYGPMGLAPPE
jgi:hypothetical protein